MNVMLNVMKTTQYAVKGLRWVGNFELEALGVVEEKAEATAGSPPYVIY